MNAAIRNAARLAADARVLLEHGSYARAASLAPLAVEEAGKVALLRALALARDGKDVKEEWRRYRRHTEKYRTWILPSMVAQGARQLEDLRVNFNTDADHPGLLDAVKQIGFYTDCFGEKHWSEPDQVVDRDLATGLLKAAELLSGKREVSVEEIELWVEVIGPVWKGPMAWMKSAVAEWHRLAVERGLISGDGEDMQRFVFGR